jgi:transcriptional repressor NrdR
VIDSRPIEEGNSIRRRRECLACQRRFTTFEVLESVQILVLKKDGSKELFDRSKMLSGIMKDCQKRPVDVDQVVSEIEGEIVNTMLGEIPSRQIGELTMKKLREIDEVAYVRFASVYREFSDVDTFLAELYSLRGNRERKSEES